MRSPTSASVVWAGLGGVPGVVLGACLHVSPVAPQPSEPDVYRSTGVCCTAVLPWTPRNAEAPHCRARPVQTASIGLATSYHRPVDSDQDGYEDAHDCCPQLPEDPDGFADEDGCPECDNDGDGVAEIGLLLFNPARRHPMWRPGAECGADEPRT